MVQVVMNGVGGRRQGGFVHGKPQAPPSDSGLGKTKNGGSNGSSPFKTPAGRGNGKEKGGVETGEAKGPRKLTKNEKRRQKNKLKKAQAVDGVAAEKSMAESNGVSVASWPPPAAKEDVKPDVQVNYVHDFFTVVLNVCLCVCVLRVRSCFYVVVLRVQAEVFDLLFKS